MQRKIYLFLLFVFYTIAGMADDSKYPVSEIPDSLLKKAKSVMRENILEYSLINLKKTETHILMAITVSRTG